MTDSALHTCPSSRDDDLMVSLADQQYPATLSQSHGESEPTHDQDWIDRVRFKVYHRRAPLTGCQFSFSTPHVNMLCAIRDSSARHQSIKPTEEPEETMRPTYRGAAEELLDT